MQFIITFAWKTRNISNRKIVKYWDKNSCALLLFAEAICITHSICLNWCLTLSTSTMGSRWQIQHTIFEKVDQQSAYLNSSAKQPAVENSWYSDKLNLQYSDPFTVYFKQMISSSTCAMPQFFPKQAHRTGKCTGQRNMSTFMGQLK